MTTDDLLRLASRYLTPESNATDAERVSVADSLFEIAYRVLVPDPRVVEAYLLAAGWERVFVQADLFADYARGRGEERHELLLPYSRRLGDYDARLREAFRTLALAEGRSAIECLHSALGVGESPGA